MFNIRDKINYLLYLIALVAAIIIVFQAFTMGLKKGKFEGKYYPPEEKTAAAEEEKPADLRLLRIVTPELLALGQKQFKLNCASCHGNEGEGNGPKAATLNPPPRNFKKEKLKNGASALQIYNTLQTGIAGTSMPAFDLLPEENVMAMAHYVRMYVPDPPDDPQELVDALPVVTDESAPAMPADSTKPDSTGTAVVKVASISVEQAWALYLDENRPDDKEDAQRSENKVFMQYCASCHGNRGEGNLWVEQVTPSSVIYLETEDMSKMSAKYKNRLVFEEFLTKGIPGLANHRFGLLTQDEINELYNYIRSIGQE